MKSLHYDKSQFVSCDYFYIRKLDAICKEEMKHWPHKLLWRTTPPTKTRKPTTQRKWIRPQIDANCPGVGKMADPAEVKELLLFTAAVDNAQTHNPTPEEERCWGADDFKQSDCCCPANYQGWLSTFGRKTSFDAFLPRTHTVILKLALQKLAPLRRY